MAKNNSKRFERIHSEGSMGGIMEIWVDKDTGINYLYHRSGYTGGMTPLLDKDGKPVVTPLENNK